MNTDRFKSPYYKFAIAFLLTVTIATTVLMGGRRIGAQDTSKENVAKDAKASDVGALKPDMSVTIKELTPKSALVAENPNSPKYQHTDKATAIIRPKVPAGDNGALMKADLVAPGKIIYVTWYCLGGTCGWTYPCTAQTCGTQRPGDIEYHNNNTATWWAWTNDGNNSEYVFVIHYQ